MRNVLSPTFLPSQLGVSARRFSLPPKVLLATQRAASRARLREPAATTAFRRRKLKPGVTPFELAVAEVGRRVSERCELLRTVGSAASTLTSTAANAIYGFPRLYGAAAPSPPSRGGGRPGSPPFPSPA